MGKEIKIIVADTNWWVSLVIKKFNNKFAEILTSPHLSFVSSEELSNEIKDTFSKERLQKHADYDAILKFWDLYQALVNTIEVTSVVFVCRDPNDNFLLARV